MPHTLLRSTSGQPHTRGILEQHTNLVDNKRLQFSNCVGEGYNGPIPQAPHPVRQQAHAARCSGARAFGQNLSHKQYLQPLFHKMRGKHATDASKPENRHLAKVVSKLSSVLPIFSAFSINLPYYPLTVINLKQSR